MGHLGHPDPNQPNRPKWGTSVRNKVGQIGQKDANRPNRPNLSHEALGHPGQMDTKGTKEPKGPRTNQRMPRVTRGKVKKSKG
ncbi:hypothetical protein KI387_020819, partial [Taxus chinensis]